MAPTLRAGQTVLVAPNAPVSTGDIILILHPNRPELMTVKRIADQRPGRVYVLGDNRGASTDSRSYGWVDVAHIRGRVECTFP